MKKYRLKKDTPTIKAGTIFHEVTSDYDRSHELVRIMPLGGTTSPQWTIDDINNFDEWFEEVKEFKEWKPKNGESYRVMGLEGTSIHRYCWAGSDNDKFLLSMGNCYPLNTPDELIIKEQKLIPQAMRRLKMAAKKAWFEYNGSEGPDWSDEKQRKYHLHYSHGTGVVAFDFAWSLQPLSQIYLPTAQSCRDYIDNHEYDLKLLFGVK